MADNDKHRLHCIKITQVKKKLASMQLTANLLIILQMLTFPDLQFVRTHVVISSYRDPDIRT